jgi:hypothetical protein
MYTPLSERVTACCVMLSSLSAMRTILAAMTAVFEGSLFDIASFSGARVTVADLYPLSVSRRERRS